MLTTWTSRNCRQLKLRTFKRFYNPNVDKVFGDERDIIAQRLIANGGSKSFVLENLKDDRRKYTHDPLPLSNQMAPPEQLFASNPLDVIIEKKVSIIGCGQVGLATAYSILNKEICDTIALVDMNASKLEGEVKDFQQASAFAKRCLVKGSTEYDVTKNSDLIIITAGAKQKPGESRLNLLDKNASMMKEVLGKVLEHSPDSPICIVSNPCDIMSAVASKVATDLPPGRIFGSGTVLDTGRFRQLIASSLNIDVRGVSGYIIGEHGDSSLPVWSSVLHGGVKLVNGDGPGEVENAIHDEVVHAAGDVIAKKGYTNWAVGMACAEIAEVVLKDMRLIMPVSTCVRGYAGVKHDVYLSVPSIIGASGVKRLIELELNDLERKQFHASADIIWKAQAGIWDTI